jgi:molecular chaperone IbpA
MAVEALKSTSITNSDATPRVANTAGEGAQANLLVVKGHKPDETTDGEMLHVGIAQRGFERRFELADYVRVDGADLADGLLVIDLVREVPEAMKPKKVAIGGNKLSVVETGGDTTAAA